MILILHLQASKSISLKFTPIEPYLVGLPVGYFQLHFTTNTVRKPCDSRPSRLLTTPCPLRCV